MTRLCTICTHPQRAAIDLDLARHEDGYRVIARRWGVGHDALQRHERAHLKTSWQRIKGANNVLAADNLLHALADLDGITREILEDARAHNDNRVALRAVNESRANIEAFARLGTVTDLERRLDALEHGKEEDTDDDHDDQPED